MDFVDITSCRKDLNFGPEAPWPQVLPPMCWQGWLISGFDSDRDKALQLSEPHFHRVLPSCYQSLSLPELSRLYVKSNHCLTTVNWTELFKNYGLKNCENTRLTLMQLAQTPMDFQNWCSQKQLAPKDLAILRSLQPIRSVNSILLYIAQSHPSKSLGTQILHLACELYLMGYTTKQLIKENTSAQHWYEYLKSHRYTHASQQDQNLAMKLKGLPWPSGSKVRGVRHGDLSGFEIKIQIHSQKDFKKCLHGLDHVCELLEREPDQLW